MTDLPADAGAGLKALGINCTLKKSPEVSNTEALMLQVLVGTILVASKDYVAPRFHMFYGFVAFLTVGIAYQYRRQMRGRREMFYGLVGLFLMGLGIRAVLQAG